MLYVIILLFLKYSHSIYMTHAYTLKLQTEKAIICYIHFSLEYVFVYVYVYLHLSQCQTIFSYTVLHVTHHYEIKPPFYKSKTPASCLSLPAKLHLSVLYQKKIQSSWIKGRVPLAL